MLILAFAAAFGRVARLGADYLRDEKHSLLDMHTVLPNVSISDGQHTVPLHSILLTKNANTLVILSTRCSSAVGELAGWRDAAKSQAEIRPIFLIADADAEYVGRMARVLGPTVLMYSVAPDVLSALGAEAVPVVYTLGDALRVRHAAIGVQGTLELRDLLGA